MQLEAILNKTSFSEIEKVCSSVYFADSSHLNSVFGNKMFFQNNGGTFNMTF